MFKRFILLLIAACLLSCSTGPSTEPGNQVSDDASSADSTENLSPYVCDENGGHVADKREYPEYQKPQPEVDRGAITKEEFLGDTDGTLPENASVTYSSADLDLKPTYPPRQIWATRGQDVTLHFAFGNHRDDHSGAKIGGLVLVNYEPVVATFRSMKHDRSGADYEKTGKIARFPVDSDVELFDIKIASDVFKEAGQFDVSAWVWIGKPNDAYGGTTTTYRLYREGYRKPAHRCLQMGRVESRSEFQKEMFVQRGKPKSFMVYDANADRMSDEPGRVVASPGESVQLTYEVGAHPNPDARLPIVGVPILNDERVGAPIHVVQVGGDWEEFVFRGHLTFQVPDEPGDYQFHIVPWKYPHLAPGDEWMDGREMPTDRSGPTLYRPEGVVVEVVE